MEGKLNSNTITKNYIYASPPTANRSPDFRRLTVDDLPVIPTVGTTFPSGQVLVGNGIVLKYSFSNSTRKFNVDSITSSYNKDLKNGWGGVEAVSMSNF